MSKVRSWWEQRPPGIGAVILLCVGVFLAICAVEWIAVIHHRTVTVRLADGRVLHMSPEDAQSEAVTGENFSWDFTKVKDPKEPALPATHLRQP